MKVEVFMLEMRQEGATFFPRDPQLHKLAVQYAKENIAAYFNNDQVPHFEEYRNVWVPCEVDARRRPVRPLGLLGLVLRPDFPLCRFTDNAGVVKAIERARAYLQDSFSARGMEAFIYFPEGEAESQRCIDYKKWIEAFGVKPAERLAIQI